MATLKYGGFFFVISSNILPLIENRIRIGEKERGVCVCWGRGGPMCVLSMFTWLTVNAKSIYADHISGRLEAKISFL